MSNIWMIPWSSSHFQRIVLVITPMARVPLNPLITRLHFSRLPTMSSLTRDMHPPVQRLSTPTISKSVSKIVSCLIASRDAFACIASTNIATMVILFVIVIGGQWCVRFSKSALRSWLFDRSRLGGHFCIQQQSIPKPDRSFNTICLFCLSVVPGLCHICGNVDQYCRPLQYSSQINTSVSTEQWLIVSSLFLPSGSLVWWCCCLHR